MKEIQDWLGHSSYSTTANIYAHLDSHSKNASADMIASVLGGEQKEKKKRGRKKKEPVSDRDIA